ncbi:MAG: SpoIIE family protein phosphatase [Ignavibacteria bacterium]|nr:SpoIIE family protein phosphatase [Ignavibacteria bacterium]
MEVTNWFKNNGVRMQFLLIALAAVFVYKLVFGVVTHGVLLAINEVLLLVFVYLLCMNGLPVVRKQASKPVNLTFNIAFAGAILLSVASLGPSLLEMVNLQVEAMKTVPMLYSVIGTIYLLLITFSAAYIFLALLTLFSLRQKRDLSVYSNALIVFVILSSVTTVLTRREYLKFINQTFEFITILLIVINSSRIAWIAFLTKKEKWKLLLLSIVILVVFIINMVNMKETEHARMMTDYSLGLRTFVWLSMIYSVIYAAFLFFTTLFHLPTAEVFDRRTKEISSLQYVSNMLNQVFDFKELAQTVTDLATSVCSADAAWIVLDDAGAENLIAPKNISYVSAAELSKIIRKRIDGSASGVSFIDLKNATHTIESKEEKFSYAAVVPLNSHQKNIGYLITIKKIAVQFDDDDRNTLESFAHNAAIAFENSRLLQESIEKERLEKELDVARDMQRKLIPIELPKYSSLDIAAAFIPAFEVGGDYYDFFMLQNGQLGFIIADVSGKGISAAFIMAETRGIFETVSSVLSNPREVLIKVNEVLQRTLDRRHFISAIYGVIDPVSGTGSLCRAGHPQILLVSQSAVRELVPKGIGLGINYADKFPEFLEEMPFQLHDGEAMVLFTDGITEAKNGDLEDFGIERLKSEVLKYTGKSSEIIVERIIQAVSLYSQNTTQHDDMTLLVLQRNLNKVETIHG